jgi:hypothetical protein
MLISHGDGTVFVDRPVRLIPLLLVLGPAAPVDPPAARRAFQE